MARKISVRWWAAAAALLWLGAPAVAGPIGPGRGEQTADISTALTVFTYRPKGCEPAAMLMVFHGLNRNADRYRNYAQPLADRGCMLVVAPLFDKERFPTWRYQQGGIVRRDKVQPPSKWTGNLVVELEGWVRKQEPRPLDNFMIGHSAGGQFLSRVAAFTPNDARRMVVANPSTHVFATLDVKAPFGLGGVYQGAARRAELKRYLEQPVTIFLGEDDSGNENLNESPAGMAQGATRYERGLNAYNKAKKTAEDNHWTLGWRLVELPGVGHSASKMFSSREAVEALKP